MMTTMTLAVTKNLQTLFALGLLLVGCDVGDPANKPGDGPGSDPAGRLTLSRDALVFNAGGDIPNDARTLTVSNDGAGTLRANLSISGADAAQFALQASALTLAAGESRDVTVTFTPSGEVGPQHASLDVSGEDSARVYLGGLSVVGQDGTKEPSVQWIFDTYGFPIQTGDSDPTTSPLVDEITNRPVGDEIVAQTFRRADTSQPVTAEVLATFAVTDVEPVFEFGYYDPGSATPALQKLLSIPIDPALNGQQLEPAIIPATTAEGRVVSFEPPVGRFGFYSFWPTTRFFDERVVYSEDARNTFRNNIPHHVRPYPLKNRDGTVVENAYILATDESNRLNDYNDAVIVVRNVRPAGAGSSGTGRQQE